MVGFGQQVGVKKTLVTKNCHKDHFLRIQDSAKHTRLTFSFYLGASHMEYAFCQYRTGSTKARCRYPAVVCLLPQESIYPGCPTHMTYIYIFLPFSRRQFTQMAMK